MKEKIKLVLYIILLLFFTIVNNYYLYFFSILFLIFLDIKFFKKNLKKILFSILFFNLTITLSYAIFTAIKAEIDYNYILLINSRVFLLTYLTFFFISHTNLFIVFNFSKNLSALLSIAISQIIGYNKIMEDMKFAQRSRILKKDKKISRKFLEAEINYFFNKSINNARETSLAMKSRGFFNG